jgi:hypothetical protein
MESQILNPKTVAIFGEGSTDTTWCKGLFKTIKNVVIFGKNISINGESHLDQELF